MLQIVVDTNVVVAALRLGSGASRQVVRGCLTGSYQPLLGVALLTEYEHVMYGVPLVPEEAAISVVKALVSVGRWVSVYNLWRPNLRDEGDNHLVELAVAGGASAIVTHNVRDLRSGELLFPSVRILTPAALLREYPCLP